MVINLKQKEKDVQQESSEKHKSIENWIREKKKQKDTNSTQATLAFEKILKNGVIKAGDVYTQIIEFRDISYNLVPEHKQIEIFNTWCDILNSFDSNTDFQLLLYNKKKQDFEVGEKVTIAPNNDQFDGVRNEYSNFLEGQLSKGNNSVTKRKFIAYSINAKNEELAIRNLYRVNSNLIQGLNDLGSQTRTLNFTDTTALLHQILNPDEPRRLTEYQTLIESGLSSKDMVSPMAMNFSKKGTFFKLNSTYNKIAYFEILASEMSDTILADLTNLEEMNMLVSFKISPMDQSEAVKFVKNKLTDIDSMKINEQKKAVRSGYDMDILPPELKSSAEESEELLNDLQKKNERGFMVTITIMATEMDGQQLDIAFEQIKTLCQRYNIFCRLPIYQQEEALMSTLPIGINQLYLDRMMTTSSTAIFIPFTTQELFDNREGNQYYGLNQLSNNLIRASRKDLRNPNGLILGTPGSGKSFAAKRELLDSYLTTRDDIMIIDPEREYAPLVKALGGQVIELSPSSKYYLNPLDINENYSEDDNPIALKTDFVSSLCELILGGKEGLTPVEQSIISRVTIQIYQEYFQSSSPEDMPILEDLYNELLKQPEQEAQTLAKGLEMYVSGAFNFFNHRTNVDLNNRVINFDISGLGKQLKKIGMLIVQDQIWNRVSINRGSRFTRIYIDEFHLLVKDEQTASFSLDIWKRFRKWDGIPTGITQNIKDLMMSDEVENIFDNSDFILLFNQAHADRKILSEKLQISQSQQKYITNSRAGEGLIIYDSTILPLSDNFPTGTKTFELLSTKPAERY